MNRYGYGKGKGKEKSIVKDMMRKDNKWCDKV